MLKFCLKCKKDAENVISEVLKNINDRPILSSKCAVSAIKSQDL